MSVLSMQLKDFAGNKITFKQLSKRAKRILSKRTLDRAMDVLEEGAINIRNTIIIGMRNSPATGNKYYRGRSKKGKGIFHIASSPGEFPRVDTGALVQSIGIDARRFEVEVGSRITDPAYPMWLEKGTKDMEARPWLQRSLDENKPEIKRDIMKALRKSASDFKRGR